MSASSSSSLPVFTVDDLEEAPVFDAESFSKSDALDLGVIAADLVRSRGLDLAVDIVLAGDLVFRAKLGATGPENDFWLAGKAAVAVYFGVPSLLVRRRHEAAGTRFDELDEPAVDHAIMRAHGGSIPLFVRGELLGTITASGEPDVVDHQLAADALAAFLAR